VCRVVSLTIGLLDYRYLFLRTILLITLRTNFGRINCPRLQMFLSWYNYTCSYRMTELLTFKLTYRFPTSGLHCWSTELVTSVIKQLV